MNKKAEFTLLLASQSPRRKQLLEGANFCFRTMVPKVEELIPQKGESKRVAILNAELKAGFVRPHVAANEIIVSADTIVVVDGEAIGKPVDAEDARNILSRLSNRTHEVITGLNLYSQKHGAFSAAATSRVKFRKISEPELNAYVALKEPYDKAGAYAVQGASAIFIENIEGSFTNVMGLPLELLLSGLSELLKVSVFDLFEAR